MRTTLKRSIGQVDGLNGNGHSPVPPLFGPVARYRQPGAPSRSLTGLVLRGVGWFVLALAVVACGVGGGLYLYGHETLKVLNGAHTKIGKKEAGQLAYVPPGSPAIALIAGYDHRSGTGTNSYAGSNSDTLMLVRANPTNGTLSLLSFPRDLAVDIYCHGDTIQTQDRINAAWADCGSNGPAAVLDTMRHLTGLKINYLITLDFHAFKQIVNRLHGVYMNVDQRYYNPLHTGWSAINLHPGYQKLDGGQALSYVRFRHYDSDIYRNGRQQLFLEALKSRMKTELSLSNFTLILHLISALKNNLSYVKAGGGDVGFSEIRSYLGLSYHLGPGHLIRNAIPLADLQNFTTSGGADELTASPQAIAGAVHGFLHPVVPKTTAGKGSKHPKKLPRKDVSVLVLNASNVAGEAANTTYLLKKNGFATTKLPQTEPANAPKLHDRTIVYYDTKQKNAKAAAQELAPYFGSHVAVVAMPPSIGALAGKAHNPLTVAAIGTSFGGKLTLPGSSHTKSSHVAPQVSDGLPVALAAVRQENGPAHFPLMVPHRVAIGSALSSNEGVRLFKPLHGHQELVLTFNISGGVEYWQIEESDWTSAPILQSPTEVIRYHHEKLFVYTSSGAIQMVAIRRGKAAYWVVNTILNQLSNSTMLAIAESLRPLGR